MYAFRRNLQAITTLWLAALLLAGCAETTVAPTIRAAEGLPPPDRMLVYDLAVTPSELEIVGSQDPQAAGGTGSQAQSEADIRAGKAFAKSLTDSLVEELRRAGIDAHRASESGAPGLNTASVKGRFLRRSQKDGSTLVGFGLGGGAVRARFQIFQGTGLNLRLVAETDITTPSNLKPTPGSTLDAAIAADAKKTAGQMANRIAEYYRREGWIR
jgi:hypothetical protein